MADWPRFPRSAWVARSGGRAGAASPDAIDRRVANGLLIVVHRGVFRVGPVAGQWAAEMAAILACGGRAWVSHGTRAAMAQLLPPRLADAPVHVIVEGNCGRVRGVAAHRSRLDAEDTSVVDGVPVIRMERTLVDLASQLDATELEHVLAVAERQRLISRPRLVATVARCRGYPGIARIRRVLRQAHGPAYTRSPLERKVLKLIRGAGLPEPRVNHLLHGFEVDMYWQDAELVLESDGFRFHNLRRDFEKDRLRDQVMAAAGIRVMRTTEQQVNNDPDGFIKRLKRAIQVLAPGPRRS